MIKRKIKSKFLIIMCILLATGMILFESTPTAYAQETSNEQRTVRVAFPSQGSMGEVGEGGDLVGYNYSYLQKLAEYSGWNIEYITFDDATADEQIMNAMQMVMSGEADLMGPMLYTEQVSEMFEFPKQNYGVVYTTLCASENSNITSVNLDQHQPLKVAIYKGAASRNNEVKEYLEQFGIQYELIECETTEEQAALIEHGEADVLSSITLSFFENTRVVAEFAPRPYYLVGTKGNTELINELDDSITKLNYSQPYMQEQLQYEFFGDTVGGYVLADDEKEYLEETAVLHVLAASHYEPYSGIDNDGNMSGVLVSFLNEFAKVNNIKVDYTFCDSIEDMEKKWETRKYDCMIGLPFSSEFCANNGMIQTSPVISVSIVLFGKPTTQKELEESTVAIYEQLADQVDLSKFNKVIHCKTIDECYRLVESGKADYGCANRLGVDYKIVERNSTFVCSPLMGEQLDISIAVSRNHDIRLLSAMNKYIHTIEDSKITSYLSEATKHNVGQGISEFIESQPILATTLFTIMGLLFISSVMLAINSKRNRIRNKKLEEANAAKSEFLSRMSHDIRTPMNAVLGFAELGKQDIDSPERLKEDLEKISSSGEFLLGLVNDVLDMTKIESNAMELKPQPYSQQNMRKEIASLINPLCEEKRIQFDVNMSEEVPEWVEVDNLRFKQIIFNLLSNAVKFTPEKGKISITTKYLGDKNGYAQVEFRVEDNGIGMSEEFQKHMFDTFAQEHQHISGREGTGLGLTIVKSLVNLMNGTIEVDSKLGKGTRISIILPLKVCEAVETEQKQSKNSNIESLKEKKILLCEDHPINTKLAVTLLEKVGMIVSCAGNGKEGVDTFSKSKEGYFDAILMDIRMPVMDGIEATMTIRNLDREDAKKIPIIAMTANAFDDDVKICKTAGMNEHLSKPVDVQQLYEVLGNYIMK